VIKIKAKSLMLSEILKDNPTNCLSVLRVFDLCHKCTTYINAYKQDRQNNLSCIPKIKPKIKKLLTERKRLVRKTNQRITKINSKILKLEH